MCVLGFLYETRNTSLFSVNDTSVRQFSNHGLLLLSLTNNLEVGAEMFYLWPCHLYDITSGTLQTLKCDQRTLFLDLILLEVNCTYRQ